MMNRDEKKIILVYDDRGASQQSLNALLKSLNEIVDHELYAIVPANAEYFKVKDLDDVFCIVFGGGYDLGYIESLGVNAMNKVRRYVETGGRYLGICAGAYFACDRVIFDIGGKYEVIGDRWLHFFKGDCVGPEFSGYKPSSEVGSLAVQISTVADSDADFRCYYNGGGKFVPLEDSTDSRVIATYKDTGNTAAVLCKVQKGKAFLSGVHFEYEYDTPDILPNVSRQLKETDAIRKEFLIHSLKSLDIQTSM